MKKKLIILFILIGLAASCYYYFVVKAAGSSTPVVINSNTDDRSSLINQIDFNLTDGTSYVRDVIGNRNATEVGTVGFANDCADIPGTNNNYLEVVTDNYLAVNNLTFLFTFKPDLDWNADTTYLMFDSLDSSGRYFIIKRNAASDYRMDFRMGSATSIEVASSTIAPLWNLNTTNTIVMSKSGSSDTDVWLNGTQIVTNNTAAQASINAEKINLGVQWNGFFPYNGEICDFRIWQRKLTDAEALKLSSIPIPNDGLAPTRIVSTSANWIIQN